MAARGLKGALAFPGPAATVRAMIPCFFSTLRRFAFLGALLCLAAQPARAEELLVFAAASLRGALDEVAAGWAGPVTVSYAGSSALARQIGFGAQADVFISANPSWMDHLEAQGLIVPDTRRDVLGNALVMVAPAPGAPLVLDGAGLRDRLGDGRLAMPIPGAVPAGIYGQAGLEHLGLWAEVAPQVVQTDNVRTALALAARGEVPLAVVYATDALAEPRVATVARFPAASHPPIRYPAAALIGAARPEQARAFVAYLGSDPAQAIFAAHGFAAP